MLIRYIIIPYLTEKKFYFFLTILLTLIFIIYQRNKPIIESSKSTFILKKNQTQNLSRLIRQKVFKSKCSCKSNDVISLLKENSTRYLVRLSDDKGDIAIDSFQITENELFESNFTCDLYHEFRRGKSQKVIGFSLYGKNGLYYNKLKYISRVIKELYPGWIMRVYHDNSINESIICEIECQKDENGYLLDNADFCNITNLQLNYVDSINVNNNNTKRTINFLNASYIHAMMWRWFPIGDSFVQVFSSRDSDSLIIQREIDSVNVWLKSDQVGHIMRDHPHHGTSILGGMWGFKNYRDRSLANDIFNLIKNNSISIYYNPQLNNPKGADQFFLTDYVNDRIKSISIIHDSHLCMQYGGSPFPTKRIGNCFIGSGSCDTNASFYECPVQCRPKDHQDWKSC